MVLRHADALGEWLNSRHRRRRCTQEREEIPFHLSLLVLLLFEFH